jgi:hypothetical protein
VTPDGIWSSADHRLTSYPGGKLITDSSDKQLVAQCPDGSALVSYTGLGRVDGLDVSAWVREVLRGESRTVDEMLIDLREQATARIGRQAARARVPHAFIFGAFLRGRPWAGEIRNVRSLEDLAAGRVQSEFETAAFEVTGRSLIRAGSGHLAIQPHDLALLEKIGPRRPRRPEDFMRVLADVNRRAAESPRPASKTVSRACSVVFMPPSGHDVKREWFGPEEERHLAPPGFSHMLFGIDAGELMSTMFEQMALRKQGNLTEDELDKRYREGLNRAIQPKDRRTP